jgi:hypothetical protein
MNAQRFEVLCSTTAAMCTPACHKQQLLSCVHACLSQHSHAGAGAAAVDDHCMQRDASPPPGQQGPPPDAHRQQQSSQEEQPADDGQQRVAGRLLRLQ